MDNTKTQMYGISYKLALNVVLPLPLAVAVAHNGVAVLLFVNEPGNPGALFGPENETAQLALSNNWQ